MEREMMKMKAMELLYSAYAIMSDLEDVYQLETDELEEEVHGLSDSIYRAEDRYELTKEEGDGIILDFLYKSMEVMTSLRDEKKTSASCYTACCESLNFIIEALKG